jgi:hypothetical protein
MESGDEAPLLGAGKGSIRERVPRATRDRQKAAIAVRDFFVVGHEKETWTSALTTLN